MSSGGVQIIRSVMRALYSFWATICFADNFYNKRLTKYFCVSGARERERAREIILLFGCCVLGVKGVQMTLDKNRHRIN